MIKSLKKQRSKSHTYFIYCITSVFSLVVMCGIHISIQTSMLNLKTLPQHNGHDVSKFTSLKSVLKIIRRFCLLFHLTNYPQHCKGFAHQVLHFLQRLSLKHANVTYILWILNTPKSLISPFINIHRPLVQVHVLALPVSSHNAHYDVPISVLLEDFVLQLLCWNRGLQLFKPHFTHPVKI